MQLLEFFNLVLHDRGWYCLVVMRRDRKPQHCWVETIPELVALAERYGKEEGADLYFALASYSAQGSRTAENAYAVRSMFLDIDCGEGKAYAEKSDALVSLGSFCRALGIVRPSVVDSGRGIHAYWPLTFSLAPADWVPYANKLKALCVGHELRADPAVTADVARILRVPGTRNWKDPENPLPVALVRENQPVPVEMLIQMDQLVPGELQRPAHLGKYEPDEFTKGLLENYEATFKRILARDDGCAQIDHIAAHQAEVGEPLWRAALSVAQVCEDRDRAIHAISRQHPNYDATATEQKARATKGPQHCKTFDTLNPGVCGTCVHWGKITSPVQLGKAVKRAEEPEVVEVAENGLIKRVEIPTYPFPFFRGAKGGVYLQGNPEAKDKDAQIDREVYAYDIYLVRRVKDPFAGVSAQFRVHTPRDGIKEFLVPLTECSTKDKLRETCAREGVLIIGKRMDEFMLYVSQWVKELERRYEHDISRTQFGWNDAQRAFVVGDEEIRTDGRAYYSPTSVITAPHLTKFTPRGTFEAWRTAFNTYNTPGMEPHAWAALTGFATPLYKMLELTGVIVNLFSPQPGTGKSTVLHAMNSIWGDPMALFMQMGSTSNALWQRAGVWNAIPVCIDETTLMSPEKVDELLYTVTQGKGKERMERHRNIERSNLTSWNTSITVTSNTDFLAMMQATGKQKMAQMVRLIQIAFPSVVMDKAEATQRFSPLYSNYGHAWRPYMSFVVPNIHQIEEMLTKEQRALDLAVGFNNAERFWSSALATSVVAARVSKELGIHDLEVERIRDWAIGYFKQTKRDIKPMQPNVLSLFSEMLMENAQNTLVVNGKVDARTGNVPFPMREPRGDLRLRLEPDTKRVYVLSRVVNEYAARHRMSRGDFLGQLAALGLTSQSVRKRMERGTNLPEYNVVATEFLMDCPELDMEGVLEDLQNADAIAQQKEQGDAVGAA